MPKQHSSSEIIEYIADYQAQVKRYRTVYRSMSPIGSSVRVVVPFLKFGKILRNILRLLFDVYRLSTRTERLQSLASKYVNVTVMARRNFLDSAIFQSLQEEKINAKQLTAFLENELFSEIHCTHFLILQGVTTNEFHLLVESMGENPHAFLSDDRGEKGGRVAIDNALVGGRHPFMSSDDPVYEEEMRYWQPVFPRAKPGGLFGKLMVSRTHGVIYSLTENTRDVLLFPVHVDPKNAVVAFTDLVAKSADGESAFLYHDLFTRGDDAYIGTGLYRMGCRIFLYILERARASGRIKGVTVSGGQHELKHDVSIVLGNRFAMEVREAYRRYMATGAPNSVE